MKPRIAIFMHQPMCSVQCANGMMRALSSHYDFKIFTKHELENDFFHDVDIVAVPGGFGDSETYRYLMPKQASRIRRFIDRGGRYLGVCMGAYWADSDYLNILDNVRAIQYIRHPAACTRRPHAKEMPVTWEGAKTTMYFYDGCTFTGSNFDTIARYSNGAPMAIMQNRIGLIGCHPEADQHWYNSYSWMRDRWHGGRHRYLLNFVDKLMER